MTPVSWNIKNPYLSPIETAWTHCQKAWHRQQNCRWIRIFLAPQINHCLSIPGYFLHLTILWPQFESCDLKSHWCIPVCIYKRCCQILSRLTYSLLFPPYLFIEISRFEQNSDQPLYSEKNSRRFEFESGRIKCHRGFCQIKISCDSFYDSITEWCTQVKYSIPSFTVQ